MTGRISGHVRTCALEQFSRLAVMFETHTQRLAAYAGLWERVMVEAGGM